MKRTLLVVSLYLLGCYQDETGMAIVKYDAAPSFGGAIGTPVAAGGAGGGAVPGGAAAGKSEPGVPSSAGGVIDTSSGIAVAGSSGPASSDSGGSAAAGASATAPGGGASNPGVGAGGNAGGRSGTGGSLGNATGGRVGNQDAGAGGTPARDAGGGGATGAAGATGAGGSSIASTSACVAAASGGPSGMKTGQDCVSCHGSGQSPKITAGGTLYSTVNGGTAVSGATVTLTDSKGTKIKMITGSSGNFYTGSAIAFPATVEVSKCPDAVAMKATITAGGCNSCHNSSMRVHIP